MSPSPKFSRRSLTVPQWSVINYLFGRWAEARYPKTGIHIHPSKRCPLDTVVELCKGGLAHRRRDRTFTLTPRGAAIAFAGPPGGIAALPGLISQGGAATATYVACEVKWVSNKAVLVDIPEVGDRPVWVPRSAIHEGSEITKMAITGNIGDLSVKTWWADKQGWPT